MGVDLAVQHELDRLKLSKSHESHVLSVFIANLK